MAFNLRNRNFLKLLDFTPAEIKFLLKLSADLKAAKSGGKNLSGPEEVDENVHTQYGPYGKIFQRPCHTGVRPGYLERNAGTDHSVQGTARRK